jgi:undecaprenyl diphosphate synthase
MQHIAMIMSGNRRWARENKLSAAFLGYDKGIEAVRNAISFCLNNSIKHLSLYAFSLENFKRPEEEKKYLFKLLALWFKRELASVVKEKICIRFVGDRSFFPEEVREVIEKIESRTKNYSRLCVNFLFCYGAQQEIINAAKVLASKVKSGEISEDQIDATTFKKSLWLGDIPEPDLIIRTGSKGEIRLSNFMLFQAAYSELLFLDCYWPEITEERLNQCMKSFKNTQRNFGG